LEGNGASLNCLELPPAAYPLLTRGHWTPLPKLTKRWIDQITPAAGDLFAWDSELPGFGVRTKPSGAKTFLIQYRNKHGQSRRFTLGRLGVLTAEQARAEARSKLAIVASGGDPAQDRSDDRKAITVAELCREYLAKAEQGSF
jgi:hypothetical protein